MDIVKYSDEYINDAKDLLVELQKYIVSIDEFKLNILTKEYKDKYFEKTLKELKDNDGIMYLAKDKNDIVGLVCGYIESYNEYDKYDYICPKKAVISELIVKENTRGKGIGQALIKKIENYFKKNGCEYIQLDVFYYNKNAKRFYDKNNYKSRVIVMSKKL